MSSLGPCASTRCSPTASGAVLDPRGRIVWLCAPRWHDDAVFAALIGGAGHFNVEPADPWHVWGGSYEEGTLIRIAGG
ncbi:DUF5911 domain-containing protein [Streptomyces thinghirensis]|nr:DUF5911 domain-containing protein [Streptomyces thinghirensis]